ncbi:MAG TPA: hypothetical protein VIQ55_04580 [Burkholderiales bacterium]|jgi:antitoxin ParD1/3/4
MSTLNISSTSSEYVRELIQADQVRRAERELAALVREGLESGESVPIKRAYWADKRGRLASRRP